MSHVVAIKTVLNDLESIKAACKELGLVFVEGKKTYAWYGHSAGDYPLPEGFTKEDLGKCEHVIQVPGAGYEIGLARAKNGQGWVVLFDFWGPGRPIIDKLGGEKLPKFFQSYNVNKTEHEMKKRGYQTQRQVAKNGAVNVLVSSGRW